jgi:hypothetical protein
VARIAALTRSPAPVERFGEVVRRALGGRGELTTLDLANRLPAAGRQSFPTACANIERAYTCVAKMLNTAAPGSLLMVRLLQQNPD